MGTDAPQTDSPASPATAARMSSHLAIEVVPEEDADRLRSDSPVVKGGPGAGETAREPPSPKLTGAMVKSLKINDFQMLGKLGAGGFGTVMLARKKATNTLYALKMISKSRMARKGFAEQVIAESEAMQALTHPFIVRLFGAFHDAARVYFLLEFAPAGDMHAHAPSCQCQQT